MADVINVDLMTMIGSYVLGSPVYATTPTPTLKLFTNNHTVMNTDVPSDYTICTAPGYADVALSPSSWTVVSPPPQFQASYPTVTFTFTGPGSPGQTVYGYAVIDTANAIVLWANNLGTPYVIPSGGGSLLLTPAWQDQQCA